MPAGLNTASTVAPSRSSSATVACSTGDGLWSSGSRSDLAAERPGIRRHARRASGRARAVPRRTRPPRRPALERPRVPPRPPHADRRTPGTGGVRHALPERPARRHTGIQIRHTPPLICGRERPSRALASGRRQQYGREVHPGVPSIPAVDANARSIKYVDPWTPDGTLGPDVPGCWRAKRVMNLVLRRKLRRFAGIGDDRPSACHAGGRGLESRRSRS